MNSSLSQIRHQTKIARSFEHAIDLDQAIVLEAEILSRFFYETNRPYPPEISQGLIRIFNFGMKNAECLRELRTLANALNSGE